MLAKKDYPIIEQGIFQDMCQHIRDSINGMNELIVQGVSINKQKEIGEQLLTLERELGLLKNLIDTSLDME